MSKTIKSSLSFFDEQKNVLGKKQPTGATNKRDASSLNHKAKRLQATYKPSQTIDGRIGFENVFDIGYEKTSLYCANCGTLSQDKDELCRLCGVSFCVPNNPMLFSDKFAQTCFRCELPFYTEIISSDEKEYRKEFGTRYNACTCFDDEKAERKRELRRDNLARKEFAKTTKKAKLSDKREQWRKELKTILTCDKTNLSREAKRELSQRKVVLLRLLD